MNKLGLLGAAVVAVGALIVSACDDSCVGDCCGEEECCGDASCLPPATHGVATPWESFGGELGAAPSGTLLLKLTSGEGFCSEPWVTDLPCEEGEWEVDVPLPPALQIAGATVDLGELADLGGAKLRLPVADGDACTFEEQALAGSLEIVSINESNVMVRLSNTSPAVAELETELNVPRCQNPELPQQAVALSESQLTAAYPARIGGAGDQAAPREPPVTEPLHIFVDVSDPALGAACVDPLALSGGCDPARATLQITLGLNEQYAGSYVLGETVTVEERSSELLENDACSPLVEAWTTGTVDIVAITPTLVHVRVSNGTKTVDAVATRCN